MKNISSVLVVCVDRDNDLGHKTGIQGPIIGKKNMLNAAAKLAVTDPEESDANCMFAAVKKFEEIKNEYHFVEVICLTGIDKSGFKSDRQIREQLETVLEQFPAEGLVLVTDGAEDDQVIPILQSRLAILSKEQVTIKQAREVESAFYTIQAALKDPFIARIVFGVPGIILLLYFLLGSLSLQIISFILGIYLLIKGFGIEEIIFNAAHEFQSNFSFQRPSFPFFVSGLFIILFAVITAYTTYTAAAASIDPLTKAVQSLQNTYLLFFLAGESFVIGKTIDLIHLKKAFRLPDQGILALSLFLFWIILDAGTEVFLKKANLDWFLGTIIFSFAALVIAFRFARSVDIRNKITRLLIGWPVYSPEGKWIGKVENVDPAEQKIEYKETKSKQLKTVLRKQLKLSEGKLILTA